MLEKLWHDGEAANNDSYRKLSPTPETHEHQVVGFVRRFGDLEAVVSANDGGYASATNQ